MCEGKSSPPTKKFEKLQKVRPPIRSQCIRAPDCNPDYPEQDLWNPCKILPNNCCRRSKNDLLRPPVSSRREPSPGEAQIYAYVFEIWERQKAWRFFEHVIRGKSKSDAQLRPLGPNTSRTTPKERIIWAGLRPRPKSTALFPRHSSSFR